MPPMPDAVTRRPFAPRSNPFFHRLRAMSAVLILLVAGILTTPVFPQTAGPTGVIRGTVVDIDYELPLSGVRVAILGTSLSARTDENGNFLIENVPPGTWTLVYSLEGYERITTSEIVVAGQIPRGPRLDEPGSHRHGRDGGERGRPAGRDGDGDARSARRVAVAPGRHLLPADQPVGRERRGRGPEARDRHVDRGRKVCRRARPGRSLRRARRSTECACRAPTRAAAPCRSISSRPGRSRTSR